MGAEAAKRSGKALPTKVAGYEKGFGERLSSVIDRIGTLGEAGKIAGVSDEAIAKWRDGLTKPNLFGVQRLAEAAGVSLAWVATGEHPRELANSQMQVILQSDALPPDVAQDLVLVRKFDVQASAGGGVLPVGHGDEGVQFMALQASWLRSRNINPDYCQLLTARGDSMEPTIRDGDTMIIDTSIDRAKDNTIYVLVFDGMVLVKRIHKKVSTGAIVLMSDNPLYPPEEVAPADVPSLHIAGRLVWAGRFY